MPLAGLVRGAESVVAPRVLVDTTAVPADRGALGRYVDGLICALGAAGADLAVACQRADEERYGRLVPSARIVAGPPAIAHRPARLAWEQSGLPLVAQQVNADVIHAPHYSMPLRPGAPDNVRVLPCAELLTDSIRRIFVDDSVSEVFGGENQLF